MTGSMAFAETSVVECKIVGGVYNNFPSDIKEGSDIKISLSFTPEGRNVLLSSDLVLNISSPSAEINSSISMYTKFVAESIKVDFNNVTYDENAGKIKYGKEMAILLADKNSNSEGAKEFQATLVYIDFNPNGYKPSWNFNLTCPNL
jgi:hypothetical protein